MKNIVIIGGGTGTSTLLSGLRQFPTNNSVIVSSADDGGSTGALRKELGVMPVGDIRQCLLALSYTEKPLQALFSYRFNQGVLAGHTAGNIILAALEKSLGSNEEAIKVAAKILNVRGQVVPVTKFPTTLTAILENGKKIVSEHLIDEPRHNGALKIKNLKLNPSGPANPRALRLITKADAIVFGPGDLYTSTIPNLLVKGIVPAIQKSRAKKILIVNLMTKWGQTNNFKVSHFVQAMQKYLGKASLDTVILNNKTPDPGVLKQYKKARAKFVEPDVAGLKKMGVRIVSANLVSNEHPIKVKADQLQRSFLRHDSKKLAKIIYGLVE